MKPKVKGMVDKDVGANFTFFFFYNIILLEMEFINAKFFQKEFMLN